MKEVQSFLFLFSKTHENFDSEKIPILQCCLETWGKFYITKCKYFWYKRKIFRSIGQIGAAFGCVTLSMHSTFGEGCIRNRKVLGIFPPRSPRFYRPRIPHRSHVGSWCCVWQWLQIFKEKLMHQISDFN